MNRGMQPFNVSLTAGIPQDLNVEGDYFHILTAPLPAGLKVRFDEGKQANYYEGVGLRVYYARVSLESAADQDVVVLLGFGEVFDARATVNAEIDSAIEPANVVTELPEVTIPGGTAQLIAAASASRKELRVALSSDQPNGVYLGSPAVVDHSGAFLEPGQFDYIGCNTELWVYNPGAGDVIVNLLHLGRI